MSITYLHPSCTQKLPQQSPLYIEYIYIILSPNQPSSSSLFTATEVCVVRDAVVENCGDNVHGYLFSFLCHSQDPHLLPFTQHFIPPLHSLSDTWSYYKYISSLHIRWVGQCWMHKTQLLANQHSHPVFRTNFTSWGDASNRMNFTFTDCAFQGHASN